MRERGTLRIARILALLLALSALFPAFTQEEGAPETVASRTDYLNYGTENKLPTFTAAQLARLSYPLAFDPGRFADFADWKKRARERLFECLLTPPPRAACATAAGARQAD